MDLIVHSVSLVGFDFERESSIGGCVQAEASPSLSLTIREAPRKNPSDSLAFRELLPQSADRRRFDEVGEAAQAAAFSIRVLDRRGDSLARTRKPSQNTLHKLCEGRHAKWLFD